MGVGAWDHVITQRGGMGGGCSGPCDHLEGREGSARAGHIYIHIEPNHFVIQQILTAL